MSHLPHSQQPLATKGSRGATSRARRMLRVTGAFRVVLASLLAALLLWAVPPPAQAQTRLPRNSVYLTGLEFNPTSVGDDGWMGWASYERLVGEASLGSGFVAGLRLRGGAGYGRDMVRQDGGPNSGGYVGALLMASAAVGTRRHQLELGAGATLTRAVGEYVLTEPSLGKDPDKFDTNAPRAYAGYRFAAGAFLARLSAGTQRDTSAPLGFRVWPGVSLGIQF